MRRALVQVSLLAAMLVLAGCGGVLDGSPATVTPVSSNESVPGVSATGIEAGELAASHDTVLSETNYTVRVSERITQDGELLRNATRHRQVDTGASRYHLTRVQRTNEFPSSSRAPRVSYWYDGTTVVEQIGFGATSRYNRYRTSPPGPLFDPTSHEGIARTLSSFQLRRVNRTGETSTFESTAFTAPATAPTPSFVGTARNASLTVRLSDSGYVQSYRYEYDANATTGESIRTVRVVRFTAVGETTVQQPTWAEDTDR